jgi:hypothetical protein
MIIMDGGQLFLVPAFAKWSFALAKAKNAGSFDGIDLTWPGDPKEIARMGIGQIKSKSTEYKSHIGTGIIVGLESRSWRREYFEHYKANRDKLKASAKEDLDNGIQTAFPFDMYFKSVSEAVSIIKKKHPHIAFIQHWGAEGDDVVAIATNWCYDRNPSEKILLCSSDKDFGQLANKIDLQVRFGKSKIVDKSDFAGLEHIVRGDVSDGVPNIFQPDDYLINKELYADVKYERITKKFLEEFGSLTESQREQSKYGKNYIRNKTLVMFDHIPSDIVSSVTKKIDDHFKTVATNTVTGIDRIRATRKKSIIGF